MVDLLKWISDHNDQAKVYEDVPSTINQGNKLIAVNCCHGNSDSMNVFRNGTDGRTPNSFNQNPIIIRVYLEIPDKKNMNGIICMFL